MNVQKRAIFLSLSAILLLFLVTSGESVVLRNLNQSYSVSQTTMDIDYLIITSDDFESHVQPLATWKMQRGLVSGIETVEDISVDYPGADLAEKIRNCIVEYHNNFDTL